MGCSKSHREAELTVPGVLKLNDKEFWLIPESVSPATKGQEWRTDVPIDSNPPLTEDGQKFIDVGGVPVQGAVPVFEREVWTDTKLLYTVQGFPCYPINQALFKKLPGELIDLVIQRMATNWRTQQPEASFQINWGGVLITRKYQVAEFSLGVAAWPRRVIPEWKSFYFMFSTGTPELVSQQVKTFARPLDADRSAIEPSILYLGRDGELLRGETAVSNDDVQAVCRSETVPRAIGFFDRENHGLCHGLLPIVVSPPDGIISLSRISAKRSSFGDLRLPAQTEAGRRLNVAVDFGTTNTAVAIGTDDGESEVLSFSENTLAVNLTEEAGLNPRIWPISRQGFFPFSTPLRNPLSTLLVEFDDRTFSNSKLLPARCIPGDTFTDDDIWTLASKRQNSLKQEFKWQDDEAGADYRSAFLENLGLIVACELRTNKVYRTMRNVHIVFTCPLSFTYHQMESLKQATIAFGDSLTSCGLRVTSRDSLVSESLANYYLIRTTVKNQGSRSPAERHVVVDIGGGTTDISVFTGEGDPLFLDSLYIGGKDLAPMLISYADKNGANSDQVWQRLFDKTPPNPKPEARIVQQLLVRRMAARDGLEAIASRMAMAGLSGTLAEMLILLTLATSYGIKMAALPGTTSRSEVPEAQRMWVWFSGLGSRLFELAPVVKGLMNRVEVSRRILTSAAKAVAPNADVTFNWGSSNDAKLSVCKGALFVPESIDSLALNTLWWADVKTATPPIAWASRYDKAAARRLQRRDVDASTTAQLDQCLRDSLHNVVGFLGFHPDARHEAQIHKDVELNYRAGLAAILANEDGAPSHPVRKVTDGLKAELQKQLVSV